MLPPSLSEQVHTTRGCEVVHPDPEARHRRPPAQESGECVGSRPLPRLSLTTCCLGSPHMSRFLCLRCVVRPPHLPHPPPPLSVCQTLVKEAAVHPLEAEPGRFLPQTEQSLAPPPAPQTASHSGRARISLAISVGPAPTLMPRPPTLEGGMRGREGWRERSAGRERWGMTKERVRGRLSQQKERKATQMLAIVLGECVCVCVCLCVCVCVCIHMIHTMYSG